ncbi:MAG: diguanylate cyclase [Gammaproteobacteria bacterium]
MAYLFDIRRSSSLEPTLTWSNRSVFLVSLLSYVALAQLAQFLENPVINGGTFWPGAGLSLGLLMLLPTRQWGWVIAAVAMGEFTGNLVRGYPASANAFWTAGNFLEPLIAATLLRRPDNPGGALAPQGNLMRFLAFGVFLAPLIGASIGSIGTFYIMGTPFWHSWPKYFIGDSLGVLIVAPLLLARVRLSSPLHWPQEQLLFASLLALTASLVLRNWSPILDMILPFTFLPFMLWAALRFGLQATASTNLFIAVSAAFATAFGYLPYHADILPEVHGVTMMQVRLLITSATSLVVAVLTHDLIQGMSNEKRLMRQAHRDELTALYNRAGLHFRLSQSSQHPQAGAQHLLICDLDAFKPVNDEHGHLAGDEVLVEVARRLSACIRESDAAARIGGDEFVIMLDHSDRQTVSVIAERILEQMNQPISGSFGEVRLSMSIGITSWNPNHDINAALLAADQALYQAKRKGKNRSIWAVGTS